MTFERLLGKCIDIMKRNFLEYEVQIKNLLAQGVRL